MCLVLGHALGRHLAIAGLHSDACKAHRESSLQAPRQRKGLCGWVAAGAATLGLLHVVLDRQGSTREQGVVRRRGTFRARQRSMSWMSVARLSAAGSAARAASTPRAWALTSSVAGGPLLPPPLSPPPPLAAHTSQPPLHAAGGSPKCLQRLRDERAASLSGRRRDVSRKHCCPARKLWRLRGDKRHIADIQGLEESMNYGRTVHQAHLQSRPRRQAAVAFAKPAIDIRLFCAQAGPLVRASADRTASCIMSHRRRRHWASVACCSGHSLQVWGQRSGPCFAVNRIKRKPWPDLPFILLVALSGQPHDVDN